MSRNASHTQSGRRRLASVVISALWLAAAALAPPQAQARDPLGRHWPAAQRVSMDAVDHGPFDGLLRKYVDQDGYVNYAGWKASAADRQALLDYLAQLSRADAARPAGRAARLAFWINAYNAVTLEGILQVYPTTSIRNHTAKVFGYNIWKDLPLTVGDGSHSLDAIEHQILRKMDEPRIHFAIVCASIGCPRLRNEAYTAERLEAQLADNTRDFFSRAQNFRADTNGGTLYLSAIVNWFGDDFGRTQVERLAYLKPYLPRPAQPLADSPRTRVRYLDYDWNLNDQARKPSR